MNPRVIVGPEDLTAAERTHLRVIRDFCDSPPTMTQIYAKVWPAIFLTLLFAFAGIGVAVWMDDWNFAWFIGAFALGMLCRDPMHFIGTIQTWSASQAIIDRKRLDELLEEPPDGNYS